jgi:hypothetical protein
MSAGVLFQNCTVIDLGFTVKKGTAASCSMNKEFRIKNGTKRMH